MKKFYAFAAAALCAFAANAQNGEPLYATGAGFEPAWSPSEPTEFTYADGVYTLEKEDLTEFKISTTKGEWADFNGGALTCNYGKEVGATVALTAGDANISTPYSGKYTIIVAGDLSTITLTTDAAKPTTATKLYLKGGMNGWDAPEEWQLTPVKDVPENTLYSFTCADDQVIPAGEEFKVATADWSAPNLGAGESSIVMLDTDTDVYNGSNTNLQFEEEWNGVMYLNLDIEGVAYVWFSNDKTATPDWWEGDNSAVTSIAAEKNEVAKYFNLQGVKVANPENGLFIVVKGDKVSKVLVK